MISAGSGLAVGASLPDAAIEASLAALAAVGRDHVDLALVFVSVGDGVGGLISRRTIEASAWPSPCHALLHAVRRVTGARVVVGSSGTGVLTDAREVEGQTAVAVLAVHDPRLVTTPALLHDQSRPDVTEELALALGPTLAEGGCLLALPDARGLDPRALLRGLADALGPIPVMGGVAAGMPSFGLFNTDEVQGALVALGVSGASPIVGVAQGCEPIGEPYVITRADDHVVYEIGSRRAVDVLRDAVRSVPDAEARVSRAGVFAGLAIDPAKSPLGRGDFLVRNLLGADQGSGALAVGESIRVGQTLQFQIRDAAASRADLVATLDDVRRRLGPRRPAFGCYFDCAGRGRGLFGVADHDVTLIRERLGSFPLAGFFGNGELAPVGGRNFFHTYTGVLVVVPEADPAA